VHLQRRQLHESTAEGEHAAQAQPREVRQRAECRAERCKLLLVLLRRLLDPACHRVVHVQVEQLHDIALGSVRFAASLCHDVGSRTKGPDGGCHTHGVVPHNGIRGNQQWQQAL